MVNNECALCGNKLEPQTKGWLCQPCRAADESWASSLNFSGQGSTPDPQAVRSPAVRSPDDEK